MKRLLFALCLFLATMPVGAAELKVMLEGGVSDPCLVFDTTTKQLFSKCGDVKFGNDTDIAHPDFRWDFNNDKLWVKEGVQMHSLHDSIDLGLGRTGNDGQGSTPITTLPEMRLGWIWGRTYVSGAPTPVQGWNGGSAFNSFSFSAAFDFFADGTQTATSRPGGWTAYVTRPGNFVGHKALEGKNATKPGETFLRVSFLNSSGDFIDRSRMFVDTNGFLKVTGIGAEQPPPPPPPIVPPTGDYRCLRFNVTKIVGGSIGFRLVDVRWSADNGVTLWPTMASNTTPTPLVASASTEAGADQAYRGLDGNTASTIWNTTQTSDGSGNLNPKAWLQIDFGSGNGLTPNKFRYYPTNSGGDRTAKDFTLEGSATCAFTGEQTVLKTVAGETSKPHSQPVDYAIP